MRSDLRDRPVKSVIEASELHGRREYRFSSGDQRQSLRDMQRCKVGGRTQLIQNLWRDDLVSAEIGAAMHYPMAYCHGCTLSMFPNCRSESVKRVARGLVNAVPLQE